MSLLDKLKGVPTCQRYRRWPSDVTAAPKVEIVDLAAPSTLMTSTPLLLAAPGALGHAMVRSSPRLYALIAGGALRDTA